MPAPKQWHKAFVTLPPEWRVLTYFQRSLMQDYWRLSDADCSGRIDVAGEPVRFLVRLLDLDSKGDRSAAVRETQKLLEKGLLVHTQVDGSVGHVAVRTAVLRPRSGDVPASLHTQLPTSVPNDAGTTQPKSSESLNTGLTDREKEESREIVVRPLQPVVSAAEKIGSAWYGELVEKDATSLPTASAAYVFFGSQPEDERATVAANLRASSVHGSLKARRALRPQRIVDSLWHSHLLTEQEHAAQKSKYGKPQPAAAPEQITHRLMKY